MGDEEPLVVGGPSGLTRRERRLALERARRQRGVAGWLGYGTGVLGIVFLTAFLALGAGPLRVPTTVTRPTAPGPPAASVSEVTPTTVAAPVTANNPVVPNTVASSSGIVPSTTATTSTAPPAVVAAQTPGTSTPTP